MLSLNYDKRLQNRCFSANYPIRAAYLNSLKKFGFPHLRLRPDRDGPPELPASERRAGCPDAEAHRHHGR